MQHGGELAAAQQPDVVIVQVVRDQQRRRAAGRGERVQDGRIPPPME
jgi:hypothetical protein